MKEIIVEFIKYGPRYFNEVFAVLAETEDFVAAKSAAKIDTLEEPLFFLLYSIGLNVLVFACLNSLTGVTTAKSGILTAVPILLLVLLMTLIIQAIWGSLGGRMPARRFFYTFAYFCGATVILAPFAGLLLADIFRQVTVASPDLYHNIWRALSAHQPISLYDLVLAAIPPAVLLFVMVVFSRWLSPAREAFHRMHGLSRGRSFLAQVLFSVAWPLAGVAVLRVYSLLLHIAAAN